MKIEYSWQSTPHLWHAFDAETADGAEDSGELARMVGAGNTKEDALEDLIEQLDDYWRREVDAAALRFSNAKSGGTELVHSSYVAETTAEILRLRECVGALVVALHGAEGHLKFSDDYRISEHKEADISAVNGSIQCALDVIRAALAAQEDVIRIALAAQEATR